MSMSYLASLGFVAALFSTPASATVYDVNFTLDDVFYDYTERRYESGALSVSGTVTTDGATGNLSAENFLAWEFSIIGPNVSQHISSAESVGRALTWGLDLFWASDQDLMVADGEWAFNERIVTPDQVVSGRFYARDGRILAYAYDFDREVLGFAAGNYGYDVNSGSGLTLIGTSNVLPTPLPASAPLALAGLALFGFFGWRRRRA